MWLMRCCECSPCVPLLLVDRRQHIEIRPLTFGGLTYRLELLAVIEDREGRLDFGAAGGEHLRT